MIDYAIELAELTEQAANLRARRDELILELRASGMSIRAIAQVADLHPSRVGQIVKAA